MAKESEVVQTVITVSTDEELIKNSLEQLEKKLQVDATKFMVSKSITSAKHFSFLQKSTVKVQLVEKKKEEPKITTPAPVVPTTPAPVVPNVDKPKSTIEIHQNTGESKIINIDYDIPEILEDHDPSEALLKEMSVSSDIDEDVIVNLLDQLEEIHKNDEILTFNSDDERFIELTHDEKQLVRHAHYSDNPQKVKYNNWKGFEGY